MRSSRSLAGAMASVVVSAAWPAAAPLQEPRGGAAPLDESIKLRQIVEWRVLLGEIGNTGGPCSGPCFISETVEGLIQSADALVLSGSL